MCPLPVASLAWGLVEEAQGAFLPLPQASLVEWHLPQASQVGALLEAPLAPLLAFLAWVALCPHLLAFMEGQAPMALP